MGGLVSTACDLSAEELKLIVGCDRRSIASWDDQLQTTRMETASDKLKEYGTTSSKHVSDSLDLAPFECRFLSKIVYCEMKFKAAH